MHHLLSIAVNLVRSCRDNPWHPSGGILTRDLQYLLEVTW